MRGVLTDKVKKLSKELTGNEFRVWELRLLPYMMSRLMDNKNIEPQCVNEEERTILIGWKERGWLGGISSGYRVSSEFYDIMVAILKVGYCEDMIE